VTYLAKFLAGLYALLRLWPLNAAANFPDKPIKLIVPFGAGGITDLVARITADQLALELKQPVVIENRPGAGGNIAAAALLQAPADGYTLMFTTLGLLTLNPHTYDKVPFDTFSSFTYLSLIASTPHVIVVNKSVSASNLRALVADARKGAERVRFSTAGVGSSPHQGMELLQRAANVKLLHVPFKSGAESVNALIAGNVDITFEAIPIVMPHVRSGRLRALAVAAYQRQASEPDLPTTTEAGFPNVVSGSTSGIIAPAGLPPDVQSRLRQAIKAIGTKVQLRARLFAQGSTFLESSDADFKTEAEFKNLVRSEYDRWGSILKPTAK
jgi:tripartite-type tricarboxylate transporter receptor subunit TctC